MQRPMRTSILLFLWFLAILLFLWFLAMAPSGWARMVLAEKGESAYTIVLPADAIPTDKQAAAELQMFLKEISGATLPIATDREPLPPQAIILGQTKERPPGVDVELLGPEGFVVRTAGDRLFICGGRPRGTLYGVYHFLETYLGCRWYAPGVSRIPRRETLAIPSIAEMVAPPLEYREPYYLHTQDPDWAARNRVNGDTMRLDESRGGKVSYVPQYFVHTFFSLVPPDKHFGQHPEYFSLVSGKRVDNGQLCLTHPEVQAIALDAVRRALRQNPSANIISVSQMDGAGPCECAACQAIVKREGSESGPILEFANRIADVVGAEFPRVQIDTLAYQYSRKPPRTLKPRPNVIIRYCTIEACFSHPLESCPENRPLKEDLEGWAAIAPQLYVWDYETNFAHYYLPHPNLEVLAPNIRFFIRCHAKGIFAQGSYAYKGGGGEFAELRAYLLARLLWNPQANPKEIIKDFIAGYYGAAAKPIQDYVRLLQRQVAPSQTNWHLKLITQPDSPYLTPIFIERAAERMREAEALSQKDDEATRLRVRVAALPVMYARLTGGVLPEDERRAVAQRFERIGEEAGYLFMNEGGLTFCDFAQRFTIQRSPPKHAGATVACVYDFGLARPKPSTPWWTEIVDDSGASLGKAVHQPNQNAEWSVQWQPGPEHRSLFKPGLKHRAILFAKVRKNGDAGAAFDAGIYDGAAKTSLASLTVAAKTVPDGAWQEFVVGEVSLHNTKPTFWVAPTNNAKNVPDIYVDRWEIVPVPPAPQPSSGTETIP